MKNLSRARIASSRPRPCLDDVSISFDIFHDPQVAILSDAEFRALFKLVGFSAAARVWTYSEPDPLGLLPSDDKSLACLCGISGWEWGKLKPAVLPFFRKRGGQLELILPWISVRYSCRPPPRLR
jgi:hypothetical protein